MRTSTVKLFRLFLLITAILSIFSCSKEQPFPVPSAIDDFTSMTPPVKAFNPSPPDSAGSVHRQTTLKWQSALLSVDSLIHSDSLYYEIYFNVDTSFGINNLIGDGQQLDSFYVLPAALLQNQTYYWKIDVVDTKGNWAFGDTWTFTTGLYIDSPPEVSILSPADQSQFLIYAPITFRSTAVDPEDGKLSGSNVTWSSDRDGVLGNDTLITRTDLSGGLHNITFMATDSKGGSANSSIQITVIDTNTISTIPTVNINSPEDQTAYGVDSLITFSGTAVDATDGSLSGTSVVWSSNTDGQIGTGTSFNLNGLTLGTHTITMTATNSLSIEGSDLVQMIITPVGAENTPPSASISSPAASSVYTAGTNITFSGSASDTHDGNLKNNGLKWSSDIDGFLGFGNVIYYSSLSVGIHEITLLARDSGGKSDSETVTIFVSQAGNTAPIARFTVEHNLPISTASLVDVELDASDVYDAHDDVANLVFRWDLESDGTWDTGYSSTPTTGLQYSAGTEPRYVTLQVRDIGGLTDEVKLIIPEYAYIPSGDFYMGSGATYPADEQPRHTVNLSGYYIHRFEVTNAQYAAFLSENGNPVYFSSQMSIELIADGSYTAKTGYENFPVAFVSWVAAKAYVEWYGYSLPTEAQWEKAARGGISGNSQPTRDYPWGFNLTPSFANYLIIGRPYDGLAPVATYTGQTINGVTTYSNASIYGVYDLLGNIAEWVNDRYQSDYYGVSPASNPTGPTSGDYRVYRGGSYDTEASNIRIGLRFKTLPSVRPYTTGFRCVIN